MLDSMRYVNWGQHRDREPSCPACGSGFPRPCPCGGQIHRELMTLPEGARVQMTRCDRCHLPEGR